MSFIDTRRHELCGLVAGVPLYHPLEEYDGASTGEVSATPQDLLLGGGSGEHPAAVASARQCVAWFLTELREPKVRRKDLTLTRALRDADVSEPDFDSLVTSLQGWDWSQQHLLDPIDFRQWGGDTWARFTAAAQSPYGFGRPYKPGVDASIESWTAAVIGEFVLVSMPELLRTSGASLDVAARLRPVVARAPRFCGVAAFPTGWEYQGGRRETLGDGNVRH